MDKIGAILDEVQRIPSASGKAFIVKLNKLLLLESEESQENILKAIWRGCLDQCLLCAKKEHVVDKMIEFLGSFISAKSTIDMAYTSCIDHLTLRSKATNKVVRFRSSQMVLRIIVGTMDSDKLVSEATLKKMCDMLRPRLRDKFPNVRVIALRALGNLQSDCDGINKEILQLLQRDSSKEVRIAAIDCICLSKDTLPILIARVKDVKPEVRITVYTRLSAKGAVNAKNLDSAAKATIVRCGLGDRDPKVKDACKILILKWLSDYNNDVPKFLRLMDFEMYEDEAEMLGFAIMEIVDREDNAPHDLSSAVRQNSPDWEQPVSKMVASEIFWAFIRCSYAQKNLSPVALADFIDILVPDMIKLCSLLLEAKKPALYCSAKSQLVVRYLLKITSFLDTSDLCGCQELVKVCEDMLSDTNLPEILVDPMLVSWLVASSINTSEQSIKAAVTLSIRVADAPSPTLRSRANNINISSDCPHLPGDSDDEDDDEETVERMRTLSSIRSLQILSWSLQQNIGARDSMKGREQYENVVDRVMQCLQQPCADLRGLAVKCLGLLALTSEEKCKELRDIIFQVARNEIEEGEVRSQALEALIDMTAVYEQYVLHDNALTQFLLRLQEGAEPALLRVGAEGSAKLLFSGRLSEPKLFANLLKFFFIPELAAQLSIEEEDEERNNTLNHTIDDAYLGSSSRLQQVLSVFFQAFFVGGKARDSIAFLCVSDLVSDLSMLVRDSLLDPSAMSRITSRLLALCDSIKLPISEEHSAECSSLGESKTGVNDNPQRAREIFKARLTACISREIMKMGCNSTDEREAVKEFVKALGSLGPHSWITKNTARTVLHVMSAICQSCNLEKTSQKIIVEKIISFCEQFGDFTNQKLSPEEEKASEMFYGFAPGLVDMMEYTSRDIDQSVTENLRIASRASIAADATRRLEKSKSRETKKSVNYGEESEEEDDEEEEDNSSDDDVEEEEKEQSKEVKEEHKREQQQKQQQQKEQKQKEDKEPSSSKTDLASKPIRKTPITKSKPTVSS